MVAALVCGVGAAEAASERAREAMANNPSLEYLPDSVLVKFRPGTRGSDRGRAMRAANANGARTLMAQARIEQLTLERGASVENALNALSRLPFVELAEPDYVLRPLTNDTFYNLLYAINNTGQSVAGVTGTPDADMDVAEAWGITTGDPNLVIAVLDDGVEYTHPDLNDNMWVNPGEVQGDGIDNDGNGYVDDIYGYDFFADDSDPYDDNNPSTGDGGHGTHVAGTICAEGNNGQGVVGVVHQCKIMALRFLGPNGGATSDAVRAINYAVAKGVKLSNNSWGGGGYSSTLYNAINSAGQQGHLFVAAAGNAGSNNDSLASYPASYNLSNIISVAATDNRDRLAGFSNYGVSSVDIAAPGVDIASSTWGSYYYFDGTSMATPNVTGVAALILSQHPTWGWQEVRERLLSTARPVSGLSGLVATGGVANALDALDQVTVEAPAAPTGLSATAQGTSSIALAFTDTSDNEEGFRIYRAPAGGTLSLLTSIAANASSYTDTGLSSDTTYDYAVSAVNAGGESSLSNTATATTDPVVVVAPAAPSGLVVSATSFDSITLSFTDNADNEDGFVIYRATGAGSLAAIGQTGVNQTGYTDSGLTAETTYTYEVRAQNSAGESAGSNQASATTPAAPTGVSVAASGDLFGAGTVSGSYLATQIDDGNAQRIIEIESGGKPNSRYSYLDHGWQFSLPPSTSATVYANVWATQLDGNESFRFSYSLNGAAYQEMFVVTGGSPSDLQSFILPAGASGSLVIRVQDTDQSRGASALDSVYIDYLAVQADFQEVDPPSAPSALAATATVPGQIDITWSDNAADEAGYDIERSSGGVFSTVASVGPNETRWTDTSVASLTTYTYRVRAFNAGGNSAYSNEASVQSLEVVAPAITLQASGYKVKGGWQTVDLSWNGASPVDIFRNSQLIRGNVSGSSYSDANINKGGAVYEYKVCAAGTDTCSNVVTIVF